MEIDLQLSYRRNRSHAAFCKLILAAHDAEGGNRAARAVGHYYNDGDTKLSHREFHGGNRVAVGNLANIAHYE